MVVIENSERGRTQKRDKGDKMNLRFGQVRSVIRLLYTEDSADYATTNYQEYTFVQYFDVAGSVVISIEAVEKVFGCILLAWARGYFDGKLVDEKCFG